MCRLLVVKSEEEFNIEGYLDKFAKSCKNSEEYQGRGWGCSYLVGDNHEPPTPKHKLNWQHYKNIKPIWEDNLTRFSRTKLLIAHARSAFEDKNIRVENNMPFHDNKYIFIFNGELRGVKIKEQGRIGAEKIFNYIKRFNKGNLLEALNKATEIIKKRTENLKAMNIIMSDGRKIYLSSDFNERPEYFTVRIKNENNKLIICSEPLDNSEWEKIPNKTVKSFTIFEQSNKIEKPEEFL